MKKSLKLHWLLLAGIFGGLAEVIWISLYSLNTGPSLPVIGSAITAIIYPAASELILAPFIGLTIHMVLSVLLAFGFGLVVWPVIVCFFHHKHSAMIASIVTLAIVWKINFFLLLPAWHPEFVSVLPLTVTLISKILFGVAMGFVLIFSHNGWQKPFQW